MKSTNQFLITFSMLIVVILFSIGAYNYWIDPFAYFNPLSRSLLPNKCERMDCALKIMHEKPKAIMIGSSRTRAGYETSYYSELTGYNACKCAFSGARFNEIYHYFEHALTNQPELKSVFLSLDFFSFSKNIAPVSEYSEERLNRNSITLNDLFKLFLAYPTIKLSYQRQDFDRNQNSYLANTQFWKRIDQDEYIPLALQILEQPDVFIKTDINLVFKDYEIDPLKVAQFKQLVTTCKDKGIDLKVVFAPTNALYWEAIYQSHRWNEFEDLKRHLAIIHPIYDFTGFSTYNNEELPTYHDEKDYYFELSHFKPKLGRIILSHIYGKESCCEDTGFILTKESVESIFKIQREQRKIWAKNNPKKVAWIENLINEKK